MSTGYFSRTSRNTPQRNINKSQQVTQASTNPSQISNAASEQTNKRGYVYKPPSRIARSNVNTVKQTVPQKLQKGEQKITEAKNQTVQVNSPVKNTPFVRKTQNQIPKTITQPKQILQQQKPLTKPVSRLITNKQLPVKQTTKTLQINPLETQPNSKSTPVLDLKKPLPYSYPKKITRRGPQSQQQSQQKKISTNENQQKHQQTPKFNRLNKIQQPQNPPVSSLPYQRKGVNQSSQNSQSANSLRYSQSSIKPVNQKIQSPKNISKAVQTSSKSIISHSSRYSNKVQTPTKQQQQFQQNDVQKPQIKRSNLILFSLHRIWIQKQKSYFQQISNFSQRLKETKENQKIHRQFQKTLNRFCEKYEIGLVKNVFILMKSVYSKIAKSQMMKSIDPKTSNQLIMKRNSCFIRVLENITVSQLTGKKQAFVKLKSMINSQKISEKKVLNGAKILGNFEFKKLKFYFYFISSWNRIRNSVNSWNVHRCSEINNNLKKQLMFWAFKNIQVFKISQQTGESKKQIAVKSASRLPYNKQKETQNLYQQAQPNKKLKQKVTDLQNKLQELKKKINKKVQDQELKVAIAQLQQQNQIISQQLQEKKEKNIQLKQKLQSFMASKTFSSQEELSLLSQNRIQTQEPTLSLVHEIYMKAHKQSQQQCVSEENISSLLNIHRVEQNKIARKIVTQWLAVQENLMLKHQINLYEGNYMNNNNQGQSSILSQRRSHLKKLQQENEIIQKFIRSYIKERYMWEQVKQYVAAVIQE